MQQRACTAAPCAASPAPRAFSTARSARFTAHGQRRQAGAAPEQRARVVLVSAVAAPERPQAKKRPAFPFTRLAGQEDMKLALLLNVVDSSIGGVLIMGDRGTGKSVAVRSLVDLLPMIDVVQDDAFNSHPTGESRLAGSWRCACSPPPQPAELHRALFGPPVAASPAQRHPMLGTRVSVRFLRSPRPSFHRTRPSQCLALNVVQTPR